MRRCFWGADVRYSKGETRFDRDVNWAAWLRVTCGGIVAQLGIAWHVWVWEMRWVNRGTGWSCDVLFLCCWPRQNLCFSECSAMQCKALLIPPRDDLHSVTGLATNPVVSHLMANKKVQEVRERESYRKNEKGCLAWYPTQFSSLWRKLKQKWCYFTLSGMKGQGWVFGVDKCSCDNDDERKSKPKIRNPRDITSANSLDWASCNCDGFLKIESLSTCWSWSQ